MKTFYFLFLSVVVAMGQTPRNHINAPSGDSGWTWAQFVADKERFTCDTVIDFGHTAKTIKELFPTECAPKLKSAPVPSAEFCTMPATGGTCTPVTPKLESAEPPLFTNVPKEWSLQVNWQAIADHCHIETLVHHRSADETMGATSPPGEIMPTNPEPDTWEAVTGLRLACK